MYACLLIQKTWLNQSPWRPCIVATLMAPTDENALRRALAFNCESTSTEIFLLVAPLHDCPTHCSLQAGDFGTTISGALSLKAGRTTRASSFHRAGPRRAPWRAALSKGILSSIRYPARTAITFETLCRPLSETQKGATRIPDLASGDDTALFTWFPVVTEQIESVEQKPAESQGE
jgi:hypothetical protein